MIVFNLSCELDHRFEGWFSSSIDYDKQCEQGMLECPMCASKTISKMLSAPRLNFGATNSNQSASAGDSQTASPQSVAVQGNPSETQGSKNHRGENSQNPNAVQNVKASAAQMQAMWLEMARAITANTEDVGDRFVEEARKIHYRESPERGIRGTANAEQAAELAEEGIEVMAFPMPAALKNGLQ